jgi:hypothetical protein
VPEGGFTKENSPADAKNFMWTTEKDFVLPIKVSKSGPGSETPVTLH